LSSISLKADVNLLTAVGEWGCTSLAGFLEFGDDISESMNGGFL
jgi:hypothetical protein